MKRIILLGLGLWSVSFPSAYAQTFPSDSQWIPLTRDNVVLGDPIGDGQMERDIVGDPSNPAAYVYGDGTFLYFRLRLDASPLPRGGTDYRPFGWGCEIDSNTDPTTYEYLILVNGITRMVGAYQNTTQQMIDDPNDSPEAPLGPTFPTSTHARVTSAPSNFSGNGDFFLSWAVPLAPLTRAGLNLDAPLRFICGTSENARVLFADLLSPSGATTLSGLGSDPVSCGANGCVACNSASACGPQCGQCSGSRPLCNPVAGECVQCLTDANCGGATPACLPSGVCGQCSATNTDQCTGTTPVCNVLGGVCMGCTSDMDCGGATPACQGSGACGQCSASNTSQCTGTTPVCNTSTGTCTTCIPGTSGSASGCDGNPNGGTCQVGNGGTPFCGCTVDADCGTGRRCDPQQRLCVPQEFGFSGNGFSCSLGARGASGDTGWGSLSALAGLMALVGVRRRRRHGV